MPDQVLLAEDDLGSRQNLGEATQFDSSKIAARVVDLDARQLLSLIRELLEVTGIKIASGQLDVSGGGLATEATVAALATETTVASQSSRFARLLKFEPAAAEEIRRDEQALADYHGSAPDGSSTSAPVWDVVRFYRDAGGNITRVRFRSGVRWDDRTFGWL